MSGLAAGLQGGNGGGGGISMPQPAIPHIPTPHLGPKIGPHASSVPGPMQHSVSMGYAPVAAAPVGSMARAGTSNHMASDDAPNPLASVNETVKDGVKQFIESAKANAAPATSAAAAVHPSAITPPAASVAPAATNPAVTSAVAAPSHTAGTVPDFSKQAVTPQDLQKAARESMQNQPPVAATKPSTPGLGTGMSSTLSGGGSMTGNGGTTIMPGMGTGMSNSHPSASNSDAAGAKGASASKPLTQALNSAVQPTPGNTSQAKAGSADSIASAKNMGTPTPQPAVSGGDASPKPVQQRVRKHYQITDPDRLAEIQMKREAQATQHAAAATTGSHGGNSPGSGSQAAAHTGTAPTHGKKHYMNTEQFINPNAVDSRGAPIHHNPMMASGGFGGTHPGASGMPNTGIPTNPLGHAMGSTNHPGANHAVGNHVGFGPTSGFPMQQPFNAGMPQHHPGNMGLPLNNMLLPQHHNGGFGAMNGGMGHPGAMHHGGHH